MLTVRADAAEWCELAGAAIFVVGCSVMVGLRCPALPTLPCPALPCAARVHEPRGSAR